MLPVMVLDERERKHQTGPGPYAIAFLDHYEGNIETGASIRVPGFLAADGDGRDQCNRQEHLAAHFCPAPYRSAVGGFGCQRQRSLPGHAGTEPSHRWHCSCSADMRRPWWRVPE